MRDRLIKKIEYLQKVFMEDDDYDHLSEFLADRLLADKDIIVLPCKVGTTVYILEPLWYGIWDEDEHKCLKCKYFYEGGMGDSPECVLGKNCCYHIVEKEADLRSLVDWITPAWFTKEIAWGKIVFLTRKEAEKALAERSEGE